MTNITRSIYASDLQASQALGIPYIIKDNTTLNEKFNMLPGVVFDEGVYPVMKYVTIGRGGHRNVTGADNSSLTTLETHKSSDAALFKHMPFLLRRADDDIALGERSRYAIRIKEVHDSVEYIAYYLRRLDHSNVVSKLQKINVTNGEQLVVPYIPTSDNLTPTPTVVSPVDVNVSTGEYLTASIIVELNLSKANIDEIVNAATIIYGSEIYATLSEIGLCSGVDKVVTTQDNVNIDFNYTEAIGVQINTFITTHHNLHQLNNGLVLTYELGGSESLNL